VSGDFNASVVISTAESEKGIRNLDGAAKDLDKTLRNLDGALKANQGNLDAVAKSMSSIVSANAALIRSDRERAKATTEAARADGLRINNSAKLAKSAREQVIAEAKAARIRQGGVASGLSTQATSARRDAEARVRMDAQAAIGAQKLATETERTTAATTRGAIAQQQLAGATARTELTQLRLANAQAKSAASTLELNDNLSNSRYLLYDVGQTYTVLSAALLAIPIATSEVAIAYERDFAQVIRTNDALGEAGGLKALREELKSLSTEIPLTFGQFSQISTIAGQLGIAGDDVGAFTETVARFGAASNVSLDEASTAFGRLQNSFDAGRTIPDFFNKIGSSIAFVGVKSAATETEIIAVTNQISAAGAQFGFTADQIVGLSGALASVRIRPELARGAFQRIMLGLSRAADEGGESFHKFAKYTGETDEAAQSLLKNDPSAFFYKYIGGVKNAIATTGSVSGVLDDIGAKNVFDKQFILGLANGYDVFGQSLKNASESFNAGSFLKTSTDPVFETLDAKLKRIANSVQNLMDTLGKGSAGPGGVLTKIADTILSVSTAADRLARSAPGVTVAVNALLALGGAIGILLAFKAAQAFVLAGMVGFQQVLGKGTLAAGLTAKGILQQLAVTMLMSKGASQANAQALVTQAGAMKALGVAARTTQADMQAGVLGGIGGVSNAAPVATSRVGALGTAIKGLGTSALAMAGGPIGILIGAAALIGTTMITSSEQTSQAADTMARAMANGAEAGKAAATSALNDIKVTFMDGIAFGNLDRTLTEVARDAGVPFEKLAAAAMKGRDAGKEVIKVLDEVAQSKGFKDFKDLDANSTGSQNKAGQLNWIKDKVTELGNKSAATQANLKDVDSATKKLGGTSANSAPSVDNLSDDISNAGKESETAADKIDKLIQKIFGLANAEAATQDALSSLGEGLFKSTDVGTGTEAGRENLRNYQEALAAAAQEQQKLVENTGKSVQQASADYAGFVDGLTEQMVSKGVDPAQITAVAEQAKSGMASAFGAGVKIPVTTNPGQAAAAGQKAVAQVQSGAAAMNAYVAVAADTTAAHMDLGLLAKNLSIITGWPYQVVMDALTNPAHEKSAELYNTLTAITNHTYTAPVNADTSAAIANVQNFASYANAQLQSIQAAYNNVLQQSQSGSGFFKGSANLILGKGYNGDQPQTNFGPQQSVAQVSAPAQAAPAMPTPSNFGGLADGYGKAADAASKAGDAGKKAGDNMKKGIDDATAAVNDYANRLKEGLQSAFDKQHGLQKATDEYYSALNSIAKKREDELQQISDLVEKQKELNNARNEDLVNARKAGIEKGISQKYGEVDRAADYAAQEQTALDAAAAKQKDIAANQKTMTTLQQGMYALDGYSQAAIDNREAIRNLEAKTLDMITAYAATGASQQDVAKYAENLTGKFRTQVLQMGYNQGSVNALIGTTQRYIDTIYRVPTRVHTDSSNDFGAGTNEANGLRGAINAIPTSKNTTIKVDADMSTFEWHYNDAIRRAEANLKATLIDPMGSGSGSGGRANGSLRGGAFTGGLVSSVMRGFASGGLIPGKAPSNPNSDNLVASVDGRGMIGVRSEEFIMSQPAVKYWGLDFMNALNNMQMPHFFSGGKVGGGSGGGKGDGGPVLVELTADNLATILRLADRDINLFAGVEKLASTVAEGNVILASKGVTN
jgi:TP901 family phage tail tape measure protein